MTATSTLEDLYNALSEDTWRKKPGNGFSEDMKTAHEVLHSRWATPSQCEKALAFWLQGVGNQPCVFGSIAAAKDRVHFCILTERDFCRTDEEVADRIHEELLAWKRRSVGPLDDVFYPAHGFLLALIAPDLAKAAPDKHLKRFAEKVRDLWGCRGGPEQSGIMHWETLFLQNPADGSFVQFEFGIDFFAAQGDGRWWHDHRIPGGIAFTANSMGHMRRYQEWYPPGMKDQEEWALRTAMNTIDKAKETAFGRATWLRALDKDGRPFVKRLACPFAKPEALNEKLRGKDWTRYLGYHHTDHSIRSEFFHVEAEKPPEIMDKDAQYLQDFTYLYDKTTPDHMKMIHGASVDRADVFKQIGDPETWVKIHGPRRHRGARIKSPEAEEGRRQVAAALQKCASWALTPEELAAYSGSYPI